MSTQLENVFKSRWGYHSCSYEDFLKLKRLKKLYWEAVYAAARYERWIRKDPDNRRGPEPKKPCPVWTEQVWMDSKKRGFHQTSLLRDKGVLDAFEEARMPKSSPEEVQPINMLPFESMLEKAEKWYAE
jgi:hypothetical protein